MHDPFWSQSTSTFYFTVWLYNNPCTKGFVNVPANGEYDHSYLLNSGPHVITFSDLTNTECEFDISLFWGDGVTPIATIGSATFMSTSPTFVPVLGASDPMIVAVNTPASLTIDSSNFILDQTTVSIVVKITSLQDVLDTDEATFSIATFFDTVPCTPNLAFTTEPPTEFLYRIDGSLSTLDFTGAQNGDCFFTSTLTVTGTSINADSLAPFTFSPEVLASTTPPHVYSINGSP